MAIAGAQPRGKILGGGTGGGRLDVEDWVSPESVRNVHPTVWSSSLSRQIAFTEIENQAFKAWAPLGLEWTWPDASTSLLNFVQIMLNLT